MRHLLTMAVLLLGAAWVAAQNYPSQTSPSQTNPSTSSSQSSSSNAQSSTGDTSGQTTVEGCLSGSNGNYTLTSSSGTTYQLAGDTSQLSDHVGHEMQI